MRYHLVKDGFLAGGGFCAAGEMPDIAGVLAVEGEPPVGLQPFPEPAPTYSELRRKAYPYIGDQLDAIWKGGTDMAAMQAAVAAVKLAYPKPAG